MKLSTKTIFLTLTVMLIAIGILSVSSFYLIQSSLKESIGKNQLEITRNIMAEIDRVLYERYVDIQVVADNKEVEVFLSSGEDKDEAFNKLEENKVLTGSWDTLSLFHADGSLAFSSNGNYTNYAVGEEAKAIKKALAGEVYVSDAVESKNFGWTTVIFAAPVRDKEIVGHPIIGSVYGEFSWPIIDEILENLSLEAHLFNQDGSLITSNEFDDKSDFVAGYQNNTAFQQAMVGETGFAIAQDFDEKENALFAFSPQLGFLGYEGSNWRLITEIETEVAFSSARQTAIKISIILAGLLAVFIFVLLLFLGQLVIYPIENLSKSAQKVAQGDFKTRVDIKSRDEIGQLATRFNEMVKAIKKSRADVDKKVKEQTKEIKKEKEAADKERKKTERMNEAMSGRELKMIELKKEIQRLKGNNVDNKSNKKK